MDPLVPLSILRFLTISATDSIRIVIIVFCIILGGYFSAAETALSQCNRFKMTAKAEAGNRKAKVCTKILEKFDNSIITILICINLLHIIPSTLATIVMVNIIPHNNDLASVLSTIIMTILIFFLSETLPKMLANRNSDRFAESCAIPLYIVGLILTPFSLIFRFIVFITKKIFRVNDDENKMTGDDFQNIVEEVQEEGKLDEDESELIQAAVDFGDFTVMDVITPIDKVQAYDAKKASRRDVIKFLRNVEYSRIPVYENDIQNIIGVMHVKKYLLAAHNTNAYFNIRSILGKPLFVDSSTKIDDMFEIFQNNRTHIAFVRSNETGLIVGMCTMEDVVEKLVGDIDEKNPPKVFKGGKK